MRISEGEVGFSGQHADLTATIIAVFYDVANDLGFVESVYRRAMCIALRQEGLSVVEEMAVAVHYRGELVGAFRADIVVEGRVILELKTAEEITKSFEAPLLHYLRASTIEVGLVLAFGERARFKRVAMTNDRKRNLPQSDPP